MAKIKFGRPEEGWSDAQKQPFTGRVISADYPCQCDMCRKGAEKVENEQDRLHIQIQPLDTYEAVQHQWLVPSNFKLSQWRYFNDALEELKEKKGVVIETPEDLVGKVFKWESKVVRLPGFRCNDCGMKTNKRICEHCGSENTEPYTREMWIPVDYVEEEEAV